MDDSRLCLDTDVLIAYLKGREPGASAVEKVVKGYDARRAANLHADLVGRNQDIGVKDVLIAAICLEHAVPILTANERHFSRVRGLKVIIPTQLVSA